MATRRLLHAPGRPRRARARSIPCGHPAIVVGQLEDGEDADRRAPLDVLARLRADIAVIFAAGKNAG